MRQDQSLREDGIFARLSRFALCIAPNSGIAYDALDAVTDRDILRTEGDPVQGAYQALLRHLSDNDGDRISFSGQAPTSLVARFSSLPYHQRVAFALVVIEEFSMVEAAEILKLSEADVRELLLATRDFLFSDRWTTLGDA